MKALTLDINAPRWMLCKVGSLLTPRVYWSRLSNLRYTDVAEPQLPGPGWVKLRTILGGICGTDLTMVTQQNHPANIIRPFTSFPVVLGHENVAVVEETGTEVAGWSPGTRVVVEPALSCVARGIDPMCAPCANGWFSLCERFLGDNGMPPGTMIGLNRFTSGSWSPRFVAHQSQLHAVPQELPDEQAVLVDPIACSLHAVLRHRPRPEDRVLIQGSGIIGMGVLMALRALGHENEVLCCARHSYQAERLERCGADHVVMIPRGASREVQYERVAKALGVTRASSAFGNQTLVGGVDVVYDCVGTGRSLSDAIKFSRARGIVVAVGTSQITFVDTTALWFKEVSVIGAYGRQFEDWAGRRTHTYELVMDLVRQRKLSLEGLLTHTFSLADYKSAFSTLTSRGRSQVIKAAFIPE